MKRLGVFAGCVAAVLVAIQAGIVLAETVTVESSTDVWIREKPGSTGATFEDDGLSVWASNSRESEGAYRRFSAIEFDISGVANQISGAYLELYADDSTHSDEAFDQQAFLLSPHGISAITWDNWEAAYTRESLESLGAYNLAAGLPRSTWYDSSAASASDILKLDSLRTQANPADRKVTILLADGDLGLGSRDWGDASHGYAPRLVLTTVPEPATMVVMVAGLIGLLAYAWRKRK